jgi:acyl carrier protein
MAVLSEKAFHDRSPKTVSVADIECRLKNVLLSRLGDRVTADEIQSDTPLVKNGLGLDSVALLQFVVGIEEEFDLMLDDSALSEEHFRSLSTLAAYVHRQIVPSD